ncbi:hypothetical protein KIN20_037063 [Parelaphostrongylus tenuis]|uniref:Uncharacterized protein n=1 Tax=Parelaphostrongylus tenuis TaxID=148309 RepID=A0AAD5RDU7_PARTN|nr:hypothetical protein KIN20_002639 [Parelaphostrongylus tenuis]KAJ1374382.1 hypothetical protein KIN20_037063 [Parelaphostrongylus tenuis]
MLVDIVTEENTEQVLLTAPTELHHSNIEAEKKKERGISSEALLFHYEDDRKQRARCSNLEKLVRRNADASHEFREFREQFEL